MFQLLLSVFHDRVNSKFHKEMHVSMTKQGTNNNTETRNYLDVFSSSSQIVNNGIVSQEKPMRCVTYAPHITVRLTVPHISLYATLYPTYHCTPHCTPHITVPHISLYASLYPTYHCMPHCTPHIIVRRVKNEGKK